MTDDGDYTLNGTQLHASFTCPGGEGGCVYSIGTTPHGTDIVDNQPSGSVPWNITATGLKLDGGNDLLFHCYMYNWSGCEAVGYSDGITYSTTPRTVYDKDGRRTTVADQSGTVAYQYDALGRVTQVSWPCTGRWVSYQYDVNNNRTKMIAHIDSSTEHETDYE